MVRSFSFTLSPHLRSSLFNVVFSFFPGTYQKLRAFSWKGWRDGENTIDSRAMNFQSQTPPLSMYFTTLGKSLHSSGLNFLVCERGKLKKIIKLSCQF